jgi:hypothetical protein
MDILHSLVNIQNMIIKNSISYQIIYIKVLKISTTDKKVLKSCK